MYKYFHQTDTGGIGEEEVISLHDCRATRMSLSEGTISFYFPDGFCVARDGSDGRHVFYTEEAQVEFPLLYSVNSGITIYVFTEENGKTVREEYRAEEFIDQINKEIYSLEFLYSYIGWQIFKFDCWLWFEEEPYHKECEIIISAEKALYQWNVMCECHR